MFVLVVAKEPIPGRVKTRLCPPCTPDQAAAIAAAALVDTFAAATACGADEVIVALDGAPGPWLPAGVRIVPQIEATFDRRLAAAWAETTGPGIQIGMDTPQVTARLLDDAMAALDDPAHDAVLGLAEDGGWWAIGLDAADSLVFHDIPMSQSDTGARQMERLDGLGLRVGALPTLIDVDHFAEAEAVAHAAPLTAFAAAVAQVASTSMQGLPR